MGMLPFKKSKTRIYAIILIALIAVCSIFLKMMGSKNPTMASSLPVADSPWKAPDLYHDKSITAEDKKLVVYGADLIANTCKYFGPKGSIAASSNGMNCQNCHLDAGTRPWGNNYSGVYSTYPKFRDRSGSVESIYRRVCDCFERSLNGTAPDSNSREYQAIFSYIKWLGKDVPKGTKPKGCGIEKIALLNRPANPLYGKSTYYIRCSSCHGNEGQGLKNENGSGYTYPPLWGNHSYTNGAGLYRISNLAGYIKSNMPFNQATHSKPALSNEEAWDLAAFIISQPRPLKDQSKDWPDLTTKPFDFPFGPYADSFPESRHKYGPFQEIIDSRDHLTKNSNKDKPGRL
jgi:thiosulfate dehydrogenase